MNTKVLESLRRIQEQAKQRAAQQFAGVLPQVAPVAVPVQQKPSADDVAASLREKLTTAIATALSTKAARRYIGDVTADLQDMASQAIASVRADNDFGNAVRENNRIVLYPNNCKFLTIDQKGRGSLVIEEQPQFRTIYGGGGKTYRIPMPYIVFLVGFQQTHGGFQHHGIGVGFGAKPLETVDDFLLNPRLPHTSGNTHICQPMNVATHPTVKALGEYVVDTFWSTSFHYTFRDAQCQFELKDGRKINSFADWERIGKKNPLDILQGKFGHGSTLRTLLKQFGQIESRDRNTANHQVQGAVNRLVNNIGSTLSPDSLAEVIRKTAEEIVDVALKDAVGESALQPEETVV